MTHLRALELDDILAIVLDPEVGDDQVGGRLRRDVGHGRMRAAWEARRERLPRDHGHLALMDASMSYLRQFVPGVPGAIGFAGGPGMDDLLQAIAILARLHATRARKVPDGAPDSFVPARWAGYLEKASKDGNVVACRHYWELCVLMALRDGLRSGDVHVPGSRRYADPASFLLTPQQWEPQRLEYCHLVGKPATAADALAQANDELHAALSDLEAQLARGGGKGEVRLGKDGELVIPPLTAEDVPAEAEALRDELAAMLPRVPIASVLAGIDARTGFTDLLTHAGGMATRPPDLRRNLLYVIIAESTNMGLSAMSESCGVPYDTLAWTAEWYFSEESLEAANAAIVNYHHRLPMTQAFGTGTLSSSDGPKFPVKGKSLTAAHLSRYFARTGVSTYTHVSDQHATFDTKVISSTSPESPYALDGILGNETDLLITEHATDTHGATLANFALSGLTGLQLSPCIRDLGKITLYRTGPRSDFAARYPASGHLLTRRLNEDLITEMWDDLLRVAASVKGGHATGALVVGKLCSSRRQQNALAAAIKEYGALRRTVYAARYLVDETYRRRTGRQLNKGENVHSLKRMLAYAGEAAACPDYLRRVSGMAAPMSSKAWRCSLVGSARTGTVAGVPAKRSSLRV
ncbi:MAG: Tn3 family transposase, partial [Streptosporangiaceae bacterium]